MIDGSTDIWFPMYPADYLKDTLDLTLEEDAFYSRALNQVYINKGRIPKDPERLQRLLRVNRVQYNRCRWILARYFYEAADGYGNRRADTEIKKKQDRAATAQANGRRGGGRPRKNPEETQRVISGLPETNPDHNPEKNSSYSYSDPPFNPPLSGENPAPPEFRTVAPVLYRALGIETPSMQEEGRAFEAWEELKAMGATAEEFAARAARYREKWPDVAFTFRAVLANWSQFAPPKPKRGPVVPVVDYLPDSLLPEAANG